MVPCALVSLPLIRPQTRRNRSRIQRADENGIEHRDSSCGVLPSPSFFANPAGGPPQDGISCEVIDLRTLLPWDAAAVEQSVNKTGRLLVSHEAPITGGFGAEVAARISQKCFTRLEAPPVRVCGMDTPFPLVFEPLYLPTAIRVAHAIRKTVNY